MRRLILALALFPLPASASDLGLDYAAHRQPKAQEACDRLTEPEQFKDFWCGEAFGLETVLGFSGYCFDADMNEWRKGAQAPSGTSCSPY